MTASNFAARENDGVYNSFLVHNNYGERVTAMRGLTYKISIPKGLKYGFYLKLNGLNLRSDHKNILTQKGVAISKIGGKEINFSNSELNIPQKTSKKNVYYRSSFKRYDNFSFIGFDDSAGAGDGDCNDVTFGFLDADGKPGPHVYNEDEENQAWTIGFENLGMDLDFDFNDVVIRVTPNPTTHKAKVELMAAGCNYHTELYFGTTKLCEVHEAFGTSANNEGLYPIINTGEKFLNKPIVNLGEVDWPANYTMSDNGSLFHTIVTTNENKNYKASIGTFVGDDNSVPTAVCVSGDWQWPLEGTNISDSYPLIGKWGKDVKNKDFWNWYTQPKNDKIFNHE